MNRIQKSHLNATYHFDEGWGWYIDIENYTMNNFQNNHAINLLDKREDLSRFDEYLLTRETSKDLSDTLQIENYLSTKKTTDKPRTSLFKIVTDTIVCAAITYAVFRIL
jgi:hypothetical protein